MGGDRENMAEVEAEVVKLNDFNCDVAVVCDVAVDQLRLCRRNVGEGEHPIWALEERQRGGAERTDILS